MASGKKKDLVVLVAIAYATRTNGEVRMLTKGTTVDPEAYKPESVEHLQSIGFIGTDES